MKLSPLWGIAAAGLLAAHGACDARAAVEMDPDDWYAVQGERGSNQDTAPIADRVARLEKQIAAAPDDPALRVELGDLYFREYDAENAAIAFFRAARLDPLNQPALNGLAGSLLTLGNTAGALTLLEPMIHQWPDHPATLFNYGSALYRTGQFADAAQQFQALTNAANTRLRAQALYNLAMVRIEQGRPEDAKPLLNAGFESGPDNPYPLLALARLAARQREIGEAVDLLERAAALQPRHHILMYLNHEAFDRIRYTNEFEAFVIRHSPPQPGNTEPPDGSATNSGAPFAP